MDRDRVIGYLAALTDDEYAAVQAESRTQPAPPAPIRPGDTAGVRRSLAAAAQAMWETPRDHNGPTAGGSFAAAAAARATQAAPQPEQPPAPHRYAVNRAQSSQAGAGTPPAPTTTVRIH
jgi:hypothetical protein